jgi:hypothetical protein
MKESNQAIFKEYQEKEKNEIKKKKKQLKKK